MLGVQCMRLWHIILVLNIAPKFSERCSCTDFFYVFVQMNWRVYNSAMVAPMVRLIFVNIEYTRTLQALFVL